MPTPRRAPLATLRLSLILITLCLVLSQLEVAIRQLHDQTVGLPGPILASDPLPRPSRLPFLGINVDPQKLTPGDHTFAFQELANAGFGWVRIRVDWNQIEPRPRNYEWGSIDRMLRAIEAAELIPVLVLDGSPAWVRSPNDRRSDLGQDVGAFAPPANGAAFARFAKSVAERYESRVRYYQIWDEPNISPHWGERHIEAVNYARMLKAASTAIRDVDPDAYILLAALAPTSDRGHLAQDELYYLNRIYAAGAAPYFDAVALQPFGFARRPDDERVDVKVLNFRRTLMIRQAMLNAGDGETPIWLVRFGWNREPGMPWQSVSAEKQIDYTLEALEMAYRQWPWVVAMGWPAATLPEGDSFNGFTLTPELTETFQRAATTFLTQRRPLQTPAPSLFVWNTFALLVLTIALLIWRAIAVARHLPWQDWSDWWTARPAWQQGIAWAVLIWLYHIAMWPPFLLLFAILATLGFLAHPRLGLALALFFLPFNDYHKEFNWLGQHWQIPPTQAILLCLLPAIWRYRPHAIQRDRWLALALAWFGIMLLSATNVWNWPAYWTGMINFVFVPLTLFWLIRAWSNTTQQAQAFLIALAAGGAFIALLGLGVWLGGRGEMADGMRRLAGLGFTSNHTALYLIRTVSLTIGLLLSSGGAALLWWLMWTLISGVALLLTASRGAMLLGIPAGTLFVITRRNFPLPSGRRLTALLVVTGIGIAALGWMWRDRLSNIVSIFARFDGWIVALYLWFDNFLFGVGPNGFWWTFPAFMSITSDADPNLRHPHNVWLEIVTTGGLMGLIWLIVAAILLYRWMQAKNGKLSWMQVGLLTGLVASFAHAQVDAFQALAELAGWNWAALALLLAFDQTDQPPNKPTDKPSPMQQN